MDNTKMAENLWSLSNGITSFAILQALAFLYALGQRDFFQAITNVLAQIFIIIATIIFTTAYCIGVWKCSNLARVNLGSANSEIWNYTTGGRITAIVMFNLMVLAVGFSIMVSNPASHVAESYKAEAAARQLLSVAQSPRTSFKVLDDHLGGFEDDELRKILVRSGAVPFPSKEGEEESWGLIERNRDKLGVLPEK